MEIQNIQRKERRSVSLSIRTTKRVSEWMTEKNVSPTKLFNESVKELMTKKIVTKK